MIRIAVNRTEGETPHNAPTVLMLNGAQVVGIAPLLHEMPFTLWIGGTVSIKKNGTQLEAWKDGKLLHENQFC